MRTLFPTAAERDRVAATCGAIEGGRQTLARLAEFLQPARLRLTHIFHAPRDLVFQAWGPAGFTNPVCEVDARPGGAIRIHMRAPDGVVYPMTGVFQEVAPPERLVFLSAALNQEGQPLFEALTTVTFAEEGDHIKLTMEARVVTATGAAAPHIAGMREGWTQSFVRLAACVEKESP